MIGRRCGVFSGAEVVTGSNLKQYTQAALNILTSREEKIISMRFGLRTETLVRSNRSVRVLP